MDKDEQSAILALLSLQYQIPCQVTKIKAEPSVDPLTTYSSYNNHHHHHHHHHHPHHHHHHMNLPLKSVAIKDETMLLPNQICNTPITPPFSRQAKPFAKLSPLKPVVENTTNSVVASHVVPSAKSTATVAATPREKNVIACEDRCKRRRRGNLPKEAVRVMTDWLKSNRYNAYPSEDDKLKMATSLNIKHKQVSNWFINARRRKLTQILHKEGKDSKDYRITRKKKNASLDEGRATSSETEVSATNLSTSSYPSPSSSTSSASDGSVGTGAGVSTKQRRRSGGVRNNKSNARHRRQSRLSAMPPTPCSLTSFEGNTSSDEEDDDDDDEEEGREEGERGRDFVTFQQRNLEAEVRTLDFENL